MLPLYQLALGGLGVLVALRVVNALVVWLQRRTFAARHGCRAPRVLSRWENLRTTAKAWKGRAWLPMWVQRYNTLGTTFASSSLGGTIIFTVAPENLKALLAADFKDFDLGDRRRHFFCPLVGNGIFTHDGKAWERSRGLIRPSFTKVYISDLALFESHFQDLLSVLPPVNAFSGLVDVDLQPLFFRLTMDSATEVLLGKSFRCLVAPEGSASLRFLDSFDYAGTHIHNYGLRVQPALKPFAAVRDCLFQRQKDPFLVACEDVHATMDQIIAEYLVKLDEKQLSQREDDRAENKKYVFLEEIVKETRDPVELRWEVINVLAAGRDTTASLLSNAFFLLARHPDVFNRVHAEVRAAFGDRLPDYDSLRNLKQIRNLINECEHPCQRRRAAFANQRSQACASTPRCPSTRGKPPRTRSCRAAAGPTASRPFSFTRTSPSTTTSSPCTGSRRPLGPTPRSSTRTGGTTRTCAPAGATSRASPFLFSSPAS